MVLYRGKYRVESARLPFWDYAAAGWYFVTICVADRKPFFGRVADDKMHLSPIGEIAHLCWQAIPEHFANVGLDEFIVMPNHVHGIVIIKGGRGTTEPIGNKTVVETRHVASLPHTSKNKHAKFGPLKKGSLSKIIQAYKSAVTRWGRKNTDIRFSWQARFYDHIIRDEKSLQQIRRYIRDNPIKWAIDSNSPAHLLM